MKTISKLDSSVINRIAAGEIIHHPYNAVKELIENSLDAGSKHIHITLMNGGLELIKIKDDGHGIKVDDMPLVCERHATSKLKGFKDLQKLNTFGFRGEALASISQIAKVTIVSKAIDNTYGYQAVYKNGNILSKPKLCASNYGTMISIQNLFENTPSRRKAIKSPNEEYNRILDCIKRYAIHNTNIGFTLKKDNNVEVPDQAATTPIERVRQIYGTGIASRLKSAEYTDSKWNFRIFFSELKTEESVYKVDKKNTEFNIFVNNRLVENSKIKREVKQVYTNIRSNFKPRFVYLSLNVNPSHIDVNIHPTKNEVKLLDGDQIVEKITEVLGNALNEASFSATTKKQKNSPAPLPEKATLKHYFKPAANNSVRRESISSGSESSSGSPDTPPASPVLLKKGPLDDYFSKMDNGMTAEDSDPILNGPHGGGLIPRQRAPYTTAISAFKNTTSDSDAEKKKRRAGVYLTNVNNSSQKTSSRANSVAQQYEPEEEPDEEEEENLQELKSILTIQKEIADAEDKRLSKILSKIQSVGCIDNVLVLVTHKDDYYLMNYNVISEEFFYQTVINQIGKFGKILLSTPTSIQSCISLRMPTAAPQEIHAASLSILAHQELLKSYYQLEVVVVTADDDEEVDVCVTCLPMILKNYVPTLDKLPEFLFNIATEIIWDNEIECLDALAHEFASFYCCTSDNQWDQVLQAIHQEAGGFKAPQALGKDNFIVQLETPSDIMTN